MQFLPLLMLSFQVRIHYPCSSILNPFWDSETSIDFVQVPPGSRRKRVKNFSWGIYICKKSYFFMKVSVFPNMCLSFLIGSIIWNDKISVVWQFSIALLLLNADIIIAETMYSFVKIESLLSFVHDYHHVISFNYWMKCSLIPLNVVFFNQWFLYCK